MGVNSSIEGSNPSFSVSIARDMRPALQGYDAGMSRSPAGIVLVLAAVLVCALAPGAAAAPPTLIRLVSVTTYDRNVDVKPPKASPGDHEDFASRLVNARAQFGKRKGAVVGSDKGSLVLTNQMVAIMTVIAKLPGGTITVSGRITALPKGAFSIPITSGTGIFAGARGTLTILAPTDPKTAVNIYRLTYAPIA
jgi:hypothetical protein